MDLSSWTKFGMNFKSATREDLIKCNQSLLCKSLIYKTSLHRLGVTPNYSDVCSITIEWTCFQQFLIPVSSCLMLC